MKNWFYQIAYGDISHALMPVILLTIGGAIFLIVLDIRRKRNEHS